MDGGHANPIKGAPRGYPRHGEAQVKAGAPRHERAVAGHPGHGDGAAHGIVGTHILAEEKKKEGETGREMGIKIVR